METSKNNTPTLGVSGHWPVVEYPSLFGTGYYTFAGRINDLLSHGIADIMFSLGIEDYSRVSLSNAR